MNKYSTGSVETEIIRKKKFCGTEMFPDPEDQGGAEERGRLCKHRSALSVASIFIQQNKEDFSA